MLVRVYLSGKGHVKYMKQMFSLPTVVTSSLTFPSSINQNWHSDLKSLFPSLSLHTLTLIPPLPTPWGAKITLPSK